jgi:hypothetical protein
VAVVKRIGPSSAFKIGLVLYGFMGLILGSLFSLVGLVGASFARGASPPFVGALFGAGAIIILPIFYGIIGGIFAALSALIYNLVASWVGGLELDIS